MSHHHSCPGHLEDSAWSWAARARQRPGQHWRVPLLRSSRCCRCGWSAHHASGGQLTIEQGSEDQGDECRALGVVRAEVRVRPDMRAPPSLVLTELRPIACLFQARPRQAAAPRNLPGCSPGLTGLSSSSPCTPSTSLPSQDPYLPFLGTSGASSPRPRGWVAGL